MADSFFYFSRNIFKFTEAMEPFLRFPFLLIHMRKIIPYLVLLVAFMVVQSSYGQRGKIIKSSFSRTGPDIFQLLDSADFYSILNPTKALDFVEKGLEASLNSQDEKSEAQCYHILGVINYNLDQYDLAINHFGKSMEINERLKVEEGLYLNALWLGRAHEAREEYALSLEYYLAVQEKARSKGNTDGLIMTKNQIGELYFKQNQDEMALKNFKEVLEIETKANNVEGIAEANEKIGQVLVRQNKDGEALGYYEAQEVASWNSNSLEGVSRSYTNQSNVYKKKKDFGNELKFRQKNIDIYSNSGNTKEAIRENWEIGNLYLSNNNSTEAINYLEESVELSEEVGDLVQKKEAMQSLSKAYEESGEPEKALETYREYIVLLDSLDEIRESQLQARLELNNELSTKQGRIELLEKDRELSDKTITLLKQEKEYKAESLKTQRFIIWGLVLGLLIMIVLAYLIFKNARQKRIANQLLALKSLRSQMNPHFIFNALNSVNSFIALNDERSANRYLSDFSRLMRLVMENSQEDLVPLSSEIQTLELYMQLEHFRFTEKFDYTFTVSDDLDQDAFQIPPMIIQPYIENSIWHGLRYKETKGQLNVTLSQENDKLVVTIEDNGIGRKRSQELKTKNQKATRSTGLRNIESRIRIINDMQQTNLQVEVSDLEEAKDPGTKVRIEIPNQLKQVPLPASA